ncbi:MAG: hypothetical protein ACNI26_01365 [Terasakiella sp.]|uniref:hypothetical protein n=1 Tax=unclassified Terasakiella TaxID=2614952 RepID=UPI003AFF8741
MKKLLLGSALCLISFQLHASEPRYSSWSDPNKEVSQQSDALKNMIQELNNLVKEAEQARAADPRFLQDLKNLTNRYGQTTVPRVTLQDDFADGNFTESPVWQVVSGKYWIEKGYGLRSFVDGSSTASNAGSSSARKVSKEELLIGVLGAVLGGKTQTQPQEQAQATSVASSAEIYTDHTISNNFEIDMDMSSWVDGGHLEFGPYQGTNRQTGYRLVYQGGQSPALQLVRHYSNSSAVVARYDILKLEDQKNHKLVWKRGAGGRITVRVDDKVVIDVKDHSFKDKFAGFILTNKKGDFTVKSISILNAQ